MLVLTRKIGDKIVIGDNIFVSVLSIRGGKVRLGVAAPNEVPVHRQEVYRRGQEFGPEIEKSNRSETLSLLLPAPVAEADSPV